MIPSQAGIGIRKGATGNLAAGQQSLPYGQEASGNPYLSAGEFVDRPFLDRINPFTPFGSRKFVPSAHGQNLIDHYEKTTGKNVRVLPNRKSDEAFAQKHYGFTPGGYFKPGSIIGGTRDPLGRDIYLSEDNPHLWTAAHELGHAFDPEGLAWPYPKRGGNPHSNFTGGFIPRDIDLKRPQNRAEAVEQYQAAPLSTYKKELVAQKAAKDYYDKSGLSDDYSEGSLLNYPMSYINKHIDDIGYHGLHSKIFTSQEEADTGLKEYEQELLSDKDYQKAKGNLFLKAAEMADKVFNN